MPPSVGAPSRGCHHQLGHPQGVATISWGTHKGVPPSVQAPTRGCHHQFGHPQVVATGEHQHKVATNRGATHWWAPNSGLPPTGGHQQRCHPTGGHQQWCRPRVGTHRGAATNNKDPLHLHIKGELSLIYRYQKKEKHASARADAATCAALHVLLQRHPR